MKQTICLNMIVKDESRVIERALSSLKHVIDYWVIVDTGSTDDTRDKIQNCLCDIPGQLHQRPWKSFRHNRNEALELAREHGDYLLFTDASFTWEPKDFTLPKLVADAYHIRLRSQSKSLSWKLKMLANAKKPWYYYGHGDSHAVLHCDEPFSLEVLPTVSIHAPGDGGRRSSKNPERKYKRDVKLFQKALSNTPDDPRATFFLAQSYHDAGQPKKAMEWYKKRTTLLGDPEEVWLSYLKIALIKQQLEYRWEKIEKAYLRAFSIAPWRAEPLYPICEHYRKIQQFDKAYPHAKTAIELPYPDGAVLYVEDSIYEWRMLYEFAVAAYGIGHYDEAAKAFDRLLNEGYLPTKHHDRVRENLRYSLIAASRK